MNQKLQKSATDRSIYGVCGGIAEYFGLSSLGVRLIFVLIPILPVTMIAYIILANTMPEAPPSLK